MRREREFLVTIHPSADANGIDGEPESHSRPLRLRYAGQQIATQWDDPTNLCLEVADGAVRP